MHPNDLSAKLDSEAAYRHCSYYVAGWLTPEEWVWKMDATDGRFERALEAGLAFAREGKWRKAWWCLVAADKIRERLDDC